MARLEVITGPMFSGKSDELIKRLRVVMHAEKRPLVLKPTRDTRSGKEVFSRKKKSKDDAEFVKFASYPAHPVNTPEDVMKLITSYKPDILAMDESQFFDHSFVALIQELLVNKGHEQLTIMISGLDMTSEGDPFGPMPQFMAMAHEVVKLRAVCFKCKKWPPTAEMSYYKGEDKKGTILIGNNELYEARCRACWHRSPDQPHQSP